MAKVMYIKRLRDLKDSVNKFYAKDGDELESEKINQFMQSVANESDKLVDDIISNSVNIKQPALTDIAAFVAQYGKAESLEKLAIHYGLEKLFVVKKYSKDEEITPFAHAIAECNAETASWFLSKDKCFAKDKIKTESLLTLNKRSCPISYILSDTLCRTVDRPPIDADKAIKIIDMLLAAGADIYGVDVFTYVKERMQLFVNRVFGSDDISNNTIERIKIAKHLIEKKVEDDTLFLKKALKWDIVTVSLFCKYQSIEAIKLVREIDLDKLPTKEKLLNDYPFMSEQSLSLLIASKPENTTHHAEKELLKRLTKSNRDNYFPR